MFSKIWSIKHISSLSYNILVPCVWSLRTFKIKNKSYKFEFQIDYILIKKKVWIYNVKLCNKPKLKENLEKKNVGNLEITEMIPDLSFTDQNISRTTFLSSKILANNVRLISKSKYCHFLLISSFNLVVYFQTPKKKGGKTYLKEIPLIVVPFV